MLAVGVRRNQEGALLAALFPYLVGGGRVYCVDAGNRFDPYPLALTVRAAGQRPESVLEQVFLTRAATCHQLVAAIEEMLAPLAESPEGCAVLVQGVETLFVDEDLPLFERKYLFGRVLEGVLRVHRAGMTCLVTHFPDGTGNEALRPWHGMIRQRLKTAEKHGMRAQVAGEHRAVE